MNVEKLDLQELCEFLIESKRETFAKDGPRISSKSPLSKNYLHERGDFRYEDQYFGEFLDVGEEIVWFRGIPVWGMGYRGGMLEGHENLASKTFTLLKKALMSPDPTFPIRGPQRLVEGEFEYKNSPLGDITSFTGSEEIKLDGQPIYFRNYIGGLIFGKYNKEMKINRGNNHE